MKKVLAAVLLSVFLFTGCDSFRRLAGRPTSADIAGKKAWIEAEEAAHQARLDSLRRVQKAIADSLELIDEIKASKTMVLKVSEVKGMSSAGLDKHYYVIIGTFSSRDNASRQGEVAAGAGYVPTLISYRNGFTAVGLNGTDSMAHAWDTFGKLKGEPFCPKDVWMLVNE